MGRYPSTVHQHLALLSAISPSHLLSTFGVVGVLVVIFVQTGLLVGFFLPLGWLLLAAAASAIIGGQLGYEVSRRAGTTLHERPDSRWFKKEYVERADRFLKRFGAARAVVLSRFVPVVRTFTSPIVGVAGMPVPTYTAANLIGGLVWTVPIILLGHWLGHISFIRKYVEVLAVVAVVASIVPVLIHMARHRTPSPEG